MTKEPLLKPPGCCDLCTELADLAMPETCYDCPKCKRSVKGGGYWGKGPDYKYAGVVCNRCNGDWPWCKLFIYGLSKANKKLRINEYNGGLLFVGIHCYGGGNDGKHGNKRDKFVILNKKGQIRLNQGLLFIR